LDQNDANLTEEKRDSLLERYYQICDRIVGSEHLYRIIYNRKEKSLAIQLLDRGVSSPESLRSLKERWIDYVDEYVKTETIAKDFLPKKPIFLTRLLAEIKLG